MWFKQSSIEIKASLKYGLLLWGDSWEKFWGSLRKKSSFAKMERNKGGYSTKTRIKRVEPGPGNRKSLRRGQIPGPSTSWSLRQRGIGKPASPCDQLLPWRAWTGQVWFFFKAWMFGCQSDHRSNEGVSEEGGRTGETQRQSCRCCLCTGSVLPARLPWAEWMSSCTRWVSWVCQVSPMFQENASFVSGVSLIWVWLSLAGELPPPPTGWVSFGPVLAWNSNLYNSVSSDNTSLPLASASVSCKVGQCDFNPWGRGGVAVPHIVSGLVSGLGSFLWLHSKAPHSSGFKQWVFIVARLQMLGHRGQSVCWAGSRQHLF